MLANWSACICLYVGVRGHFVLLLKSPVAVAFPCGALRPVGVFICVCKRFIRMHACASEHTHTRTDTHVLNVRLHSSGISKRSTPKTSRSVVRVRDFEAHSTRARELVRRTPQTRYGYNAEGTLAVRQVLVSSVRWRKRNDPIIAVEPVLSWAYRNPYGSESVRRVLL